MSSKILRGVHQSVDFLNYKNAPRMFVWYRDARDKYRRRLLEITNFSPHFYVEGDQRGVNSPYIKKAYYDRYVNRNLQGERVTKIETNISSDVRHLRDNEFDGMQTYQAAILLPRTFLIANRITSGFHIDVNRVTKESHRYNGSLIYKTRTEHLKPSSKIYVAPRIQYGDFEIDNSDGSLADATVGDLPITMYSWIDSYDPFKPKSIVWHPKWANKQPTLVKKEYIYEYTGEKHEWHIHCFPNEIDMLHYLIKVIGLKEDPDIMTGWNFTEFDMTYLINRIRHINATSLESHKPENFIDIRRISPLCRLADYRGWSSSNAKVSAKNGRVYIPGREILDMYKAYRKMVDPAEGKKDSYTLDNIGFTELKLRKIVHEGSVGQLWMRDPLAALIYNMRDSEICYFLDNVKGIFNNFDTQRREVGCLWRDVLSPAIVLGTDQTRAANKKGIVLPTTYVPDKNKKKKFKGAIVLPATVGLHYNVLAFDLKSLYLNLIDQWNISPDVFVDTLSNLKKKHNNSQKILSSYVQNYIRTPNGLLWEKRKDGFARERVRHYQIERQKIRDKHAQLKEINGADNIEVKNLDTRQKAYKTFSLVFWGVFGHEGSELYWEPMAEAVTSSGRTVINFTRDRVESTLMQKKLELQFGEVKDLRVVYGDTDSVYVLVQFTDEMLNQDMDFMCDVADYISKFLNDGYPLLAKKYNCPTNCMHIRCEKIYKSYFMTVTGKGTAGKKRYVGLKVRELLQERGKERWIVTNKEDIKGFESRRSDNSKVGKDFQKSIFSILMHGKGIKDIRRKLKHLIRKTQMEFFSGNHALTDIAIPKGISRPLGSYGKLNPHSGRRSSIPIHVRAAKYSNQNFKTNYNGGSKVYYIYVEDVPRIYPKTDVIAFQYDHEVPKGVVVDYNKMWEKQFIKKAEAIFRGLNTTYKQIVGGVFKNAFDSWDSN